MPQHPFTNIKALCSTLIPTCIRPLAVVTVYRLYVEHLGSVVYRTWDVGLKDAKGLKFRSYVCGDCEEFRDSRYSTCKDLCSLIKSCSSVAT